MLLSIDKPSEDIHYKLLVLEQRLEKQDILLARDNKSCKEKETDSSQKRMIENYSIG